MAPVTTTTTAPVVVGVADTPTARRAAHHAARLARDIGAPLHLVMSVDRGATTLSVGGGDRFHIDWLSAAEQYLDGIRGELDAGSVTRTVSLEDPVTALCTEAERLGARFIVVGNRRVQGAGRVLGAVAVDVARRARCDVVIASTCTP